jgi:hypothetical protein
LASAQAGQAQSRRIDLDVRKAADPIDQAEGILHAWRIGQEERWPLGGTVSTRHLHLRVVNDEDVVTFYYSTDGTRWIKERSFEVSGYNHNVADGFLSLRPGIYASGKGGVTFNNLLYRARPTRR